jgi:carboxyl-terminal processing protease
MRLNERRGLAWLAILAAASIVTGGWMLESADGAAEHHPAERFAEVLRLISNEYVDPVDAGRLHEMAIDGMLEGLDPHSRFLTPGDYAQFRLEALGEYAGIGAEVGLRGDWVTVISPLPGSPAERAGLRAGDRIVEIDGMAASGWSQQRAVRHLRGPRGTDVTIGISRDGVERVIRVHLVREEIRRQAVPSALLIEGDIGYVELAGFGSATAVELQAELDRVVSLGARKLIVDVRRNPGGVMTEGIAAADLFLDRGSPIASVRGRSAGTSQRFLATSADRYAGMPLVVLVGQGSASASEIVAGAIQDMDRGLVIGEPSYGKGLVQTMYPLYEDHWLILTTARWYTPLGRSIQRQSDAPATSGSDSDAERFVYRTAAGRVMNSDGGIFPDFVVPLDTLEGAERRLAQSIVEQGATAYFSARLQFTVSYLAANPDLVTDFVVTEPMLDDFFDDLQRAGVRVDRSEYDAASGWVAFSLADDIAYSKWGEVERRRRQYLRDSQVMAAVGLLKQAPSTQALLGLNPSTN